MNRHLTEEDIKSVLMRAEEIHSGTSIQSDGGDVLLAAEEAGLPRGVVEQALREHLDHFVTPPGPGDQVYAQSSDDLFYVADVLDVSDQGVSVKFIKGGESTLDVQHVRPCGFLPGEQVEVHWPPYGWWECTVLNYDSENRRLRVDDGWGTEGQFPLSDIRLPRTKPKKGRRAVVWSYLALISITAAISSVLTWIVMR